MYYKKLIEYIESQGYNLKKNDRQIQTACPICREEGRDKSCNHFGINTETGVYNCIVDSDHTKEISKRIREADSKKNTDFVSTNDLIITQNFIDKCKNDLLSDKEKMSIFSDIRGFSYDTIAEMQLGYVNECNVFNIPLFDFNGEIIGSEFTTTDFKKKWKSKGSKSELCQIHKEADSKYIIIFEGPYDAIAFYQYLKEKHQLDLFTLLTPTCGVNSIAKLIKEVKLEEDQKLVMCLDNDFTGRKALRDISYKSNYILHQMKLPCTCCKDFNEYYLKHLKELESLNPEEHIKVIPITHINTHIRHPNSYELGEVYYISDYYNIYSFRNQLIEYKNAYFEVAARVKTEGKGEDRIEYTSISIKRLSNYILEAQEVIIEADDDSSRNNNHTIRVKATPIKGKSSDSIILKK